MDAAAWDERYRAKELIWTAEPNRWVVQEAADLPPGRALDLAAGEGRNAVWLATRGWDVTAVDFSQVAIDKGRQLAAHRDVAIEWVVADATTWQPAAQAYDLVLVVYLHLPPAQRAAVLRSAASGVTPGGTLLVIGHDRDNLTRGVGGPPDARVLYDADEIATDLETSGLTVERSEQVLRPVRTDDGERTAVDTLVRAHR